MKNTVLTLQKQKEEHDKIVMVTAYDYTTAKIMDEAGVNTILVGDSLGMVMLGYEDTLSVTMEDMIHHTAAVSRGAKDAFVVADMPFMSYQTSVYDAVVNAGRLMKEGRANAVKLEGGVEFAPHIEAIVKASIPVVAHIGLTPQSVNAFGGFKVQGKDVEAAKKLLADAKAVEAAVSRIMTLVRNPSLTYSSSSMLLHSNGRTSSLFGVSSFARNKEEEKKVMKFLFQYIVLFVRAITVYGILNFHPAVWIWKGWNQTYLPVHRTF